MGSFLGLPDGASGKEPAYLCRRNQRAGLIPGSGRFPGGRAWKPTTVFLPGESHGQRSLAGYSWQGCKEPDTTKVTYHTYKENFVKVLLFKTVWKFFKKTKNKTTIQSSNSAPGYISKEEENTISKRYIYPNVNSSIIYNGHDMEATIMRWMDKENVICVHTLKNNGTLKKNGILPLATMWIDL